MAIGIDEDDTGRFLQFSSLDAEEGAGSAGCGSVDAQDGTLASGVFWGSGG
jgi:hypothetical protein